MKKILGLFLAMAAAGSVWADTEGTVNVPVLNARQEPTVKSPVMMRLKEGQKVNIIRRCGENWLEIAAPSDAPVYVDETLAVGGKAHRDIRMYSGKGRSFPAWGDLKKGEEVELKDDRGYGWVRIAPPERLRIYVVALYIDGADAVKSEAEAEAAAKPAAKPVAKPAAKPAAKAEAKPAAKPAAKAEAKPAAKPEAKPAAKPEAKPAAKPAAKPEAKPAAKADAKKPAAKPAAKADAKKPAAKPAAKADAKKPAAKPAAKKPAPKPALQPFKPDAALIELGIKPEAKGQLVVRTGTVIESTSDLKAASFMLKDARGEMLGFIYYPNRAVELKKSLSARVTVRGTEFPVKGWKKPVIVVQKLEKVR